MVAGTNAEGFGKILVCCKSMQINIMYQLSLLIHVIHLHILSYVWLSGSFKPFWLFQEPCTQIVGYGNKFG